MFDFKIKNTCKRARTGFFNTPHGKLETPNLAIVATHGKIKLLDEIDQKRADPDLTISNTFHLFVNKKVGEIKKAGGLHKWSGFKNPIMTDSGGFQVFSLGWGKIHRIGKILGAENLSSLIRSERQNSSSLIYVPLSGTTRSLLMRSRSPEGHFKTLSAILTPKEFYALRRNKIFCRIRCYAIA